jgi:isocitrate/isopropylmalate dehydrogenase
MNTAACFLDPAHPGDLADVAGPEAGLLRLRKDMNLFANLRPLADASSLKRELVDGLDLMVVRELTGGVYFGEPKQIIDLGNGQKRAIDTQDCHTYEIERIGRVAFELAGQRRNKVPSSDERNVMKSGVLWDEVITALRAREYPDASFCNLKLYRRIATRYDKTDQRFKGKINLAATAIALK